MIEPFLAAARSIVGPAHVLTDPDLTASYAEDWTLRWSGRTAGVVRPASTAEVARLVAEARRHHVVLVPQGGNTGLVGGSVPHRGEVVLSLRRMDGLEPVDLLAGQVTAGAGVLLASLQEHARSAGLAFGVDLGARGAATVGGMIATNAGGLHVVRYGAMRAQVMGVEAVLGNGAVVSRLAGLVKDNTGYDLAQLLCGSEGTLGVVTRARLRLVPASRALVVAFLAVPSMAAGVRIAARLRQEVEGIQALELMAGDSLRTVAGHTGLPLPVRADAGAFLLVEVEGSEDPTDRLANAIGLGARSGGLSAGPSGEDTLLDTAVAVTESDRSRLWRLREEHSSAAVSLAAAQGATVHKLDVTLPSEMLAPFCEEVTAMVEQRWPGAVTLLYGHVGDGNIHVNVVPSAVSGPAAGDEHLIDDAVLEMVVARGGSISAEHGVGVAKRAWLARNRSSAEVAAMRAVKDALDPDHILNPHILLP